MNAKFFAQKKQEKFKCPDIHKTIDISLACDIGSNCTFACVMRGPIFKNPDHEKTFAKDNKILFYPNDTKNGNNPTCLCLYQEEEEQGGAWKYIQGLPGKREHENRINPVNNKKSNLITHFKYLLGLTPEQYIKTPQNFSFAVCTREYDIETCLDPGFKKATNPDANGNKEQELCVLVNGEKKKRVIPVSEIYNIYVEELLKSVREMYIESIKSSLQHYISAHQLKTTKDALFETLNFNENCIFTIPVKWNSQSTRITQMYSSLNTVFSCDYNNLPNTLSKFELVNEPSAAAKNFLSQVDDDFGSGSVAIVDVGGGTTDFSIVYLSKNVINQLELSGEQIGGSDFDFALLKAFCIKKSEKLGLNLKFEEGKNRHILLKELKDFCLTHFKMSAMTAMLQLETSKKEFFDYNTGKSLTIHFQGLPMTSEELQVIWNPIIDKIADLAFNSVKKVYNVHGEIGLLVYVGGGCGVTWLRKAINEKLKGMVKQEKYELHSSKTAVCNGAALMGFYRDNHAASDKRSISLHIKFPFDLLVFGLCGDTVSPYSSSVNNYKVGLGYLRIPLHSENVGSSKCFNFSAETFTVNLLLALQCPKTKKIIPIRFSQLNLFENVTTVEKMGNCQAWVFQISVSVENCSSLVLRISDPFSKINKLFPDIRLCSDEYAKNESVFQDFDIKKYNNSTKLCKYLGKHLDHL